MYEHCKDNNEGTVRKNKKIDIDNNIKNNIDIDNDNNNNFNILKLELWSKCGEWGPWFPRGLEGAVFTSVLSCKIQPMKIRKEGYNYIFESILLEFL